jgi:uncharacterized protein with GYD domain
LAPAFSLTTGHVQQVDLFWRNHLKGISMPTYIIIGTFTDQGIRSVKETTKRAEALREMAKKTGVTVRDIFWTLGQYDVIAVLDAPDDEAVTALGLSIGALGNVRAQTLRAFSENEIVRVLSKMK